MNLKPLRYLLPICLFAFPALAADQVVLKNGETIIGSIVRKDGGRLIIKSEFLGEVSMPWSAIRGIRSDSELSVVLPTGETVKGKLATTGDKLEVVAAGAPNPVPLAGVTALRNAPEQEKYERLQHAGILELWNGNFDVGLALSRGNTRSDTLSTVFTAKRITRTDKLALSFSQIYGTARANNETSTIASSIRGGWKYDRTVSGRMFVTGFNDYEHDRFQNLDLRFVAGLGLGVHAVKKENTQLDFDGGANYEGENFIKGQHRNSAEANFGDALSIKLSKAVSLTQSMRVFTNLTDTGAYRLNFDLGSNTVLKRWLGWHVTASDRFVSNPISGRQRNDLLVATGFRLSFTH